MCKLPRRCFGGCALLMGDFPKTPGVGCTVSLLLNLCAYVNGQRPHELASRRRDAANWKEKTLLVVADVSKNKRDPLVALTDLAVVILERLRRKTLTIVRITFRNGWMRASIYEPTALRRQSSVTRALSGQAGVFCEGFTADLQNTDERNWCLERAA